MSLQQIDVYVLTFQDILPIFVPIHKLMFENVLNQSMLKGHVFLIF
jgi:hypothetical protein